MALYSKLIITVDNVGKRVHKFCNVWRDDVVFFAPALCEFVSYMLHALKAGKGKKKFGGQRMVTSQLQWVVPRSRGMDFRGKGKTVLLSGPMQDRAGGVECE